MSKMSENERLLNEIEYLKKLISEEKRLSRNNMTGSSVPQSKDNHRTQVHGSQANVPQVPVVDGATVKKKETVPPVGSTSRYKWVGTKATTTQEPKARNIDKAFARDEERGKVVEPSYPNVSGVSRGNTNNSTELSARGSLLENNVKDGKGATSNSGDNIKNEAVQFLKTKFTNRTVHLNRHHATFSAQDLNKLRKSSAQGTQKTSKEAKPSQSDERKSAAMSFLKEAGVLPNAAVPLTSKSPVTEPIKPLKHTKQNFKIDRRPPKPPPANEKAQSSKEHTISKLVSKSKHKLVRAHISAAPDKETIVKYPSGNSGIYSTMPLSNSHNSQSFVSKKVSKYKIVKKQTSLPLCAGLSSVSKHEVSSTASKFKTEKRRVSSPEKNETRTPQHRGKKQSLSKYKWSRLQNNVVHWQQFKALGTPRSFKIKTTFKLVRKALKNTQGKLQNLDKKPLTTTPKHRIKNSKYKLVNKGRTGSASLTWKSRYALKRTNTTLDSLNINKLLGRNVVNLSRNKYKFVSGSQRQFRKGNVSSLPARVLERKLKHSSKSKFKLDRRVPDSPRAKYSDGVVKNTNLVLIGGILYKSSRRRLVKSEPADSNKNAGRRYSLRNLRNPRMRAVIVRGVKYEMDASGLSLHRVKAPGSQGSSVMRLDIGGVTYLQTRPGTLVKASTQVKRIVASRSLHKSIVRTTAPKKKTEKKYCMFYNRFGKCNRGKNCKYIHDPDKIAICTRFLRGTCSVTDCPFSHKVAREKMPVCLHYLKGTCSRENCPYRHIKMSRDAEICQDFLNGYCSKGDLCNKQHTTVCLEFMETGKCLREGKCKLYHPKRAKKRKLLKNFEKSSQSTENRPQKMLKIEEKKDDDFHLPLSKRHLPAYISLDSGSNEVVSSVKTTETNGSKEASWPLKIKPTFT